MKSIYVLTVIALVVLAGMLTIYTSSRFLPVAASAAAHSLEYLSAAPYDRGEEASVHFFKAVFTTNPEAVAAARVQVKLFSHPVSMERVTLGRE
jgi:hypothetical protein